MDKNVTSIDLFAYFFFNFIADFMSIIKPELGVQSNYYADKSIGSGSSDL